MCQPAGLPNRRRSIAAIAQHRGANGADSGSTIVLNCNFRKTRADTFWVISHNADSRQISGSSNWRIEVDGQPCTDRRNNIKGSIDAAFHGAGPNMHRPMYVRGICYRTANQATIRAGNHAVRWRQTRTSGDSYWGWSSNARIMVEVRTSRRGEGGEERVTRPWLTLLLSSVLACALPCSADVLFGTFFTRRNGSREHDSARTVSEPATTLITGVSCGALLRFFLTTYSAQCFHRASSCVFVGAVDLYSAQRSSKYSFHRPEKGYCTSIRGLSGEVLFYSWAIDLAHRTELGAIFFPSGGRS